MSDLPVSLVNELRAWNETTVDFPALPLPALLRHRAELCPDAIAVQDLSESLSYAELVAQAHRLARYLQGLGVQPGTRVACALPRGVPAIVVHVAVFALGAVRAAVRWVAIRLRAKSALARGLAYAEVKWSMKS
ncbi:AMP-binding protein [Streptomyces cellulosae]|uniref:AMP-binding protein n=1 Tax=Streptomyces cellulosae TaxID=1968 RepID=A0ABW7YI29_STRCE